MRFERPLTKVRVETHACNIQLLLLFHSNSGYANAPHYMYNRSPRNYTASRSKSPKSWHSSENLKSQQNRGHLFCPIYYTVIVSHHVESVWKRKYNQNISRYSVEAERSLPCQQGPVSVPSLQPANPLHLRTPWFNLNVISKCLL